MMNIKCIICNEDNSQKIATGFDRYTLVDKTLFNLVRCKKCSLVYINPQPSMQELNKYYPPHYPPFIKAKEKIVLPENRKADTATEKTVLDFGCGAGKNLLALRAEHTKWELYGFDISANKEVVTIGNDISIIYDDINKLKDSFNHGYFDIIYMNNVLEHLSDPIQTLKDLKHLLKDDGTIIIEVPNIDSIKFKIFGKYFSSLDIPRHLYNFSPKTLSVVCEKSGLRIKSFTLNGSTKSTLRSIYYMCGIYKKDLNRILFKIINTITKIIGEKNINEDVIVAIVVKS